MDDLKKAFHAKKRPLYPARQRFSLVPKAGEKRGEALVDGRPLAAYALQTGSVLHFKDLGPQVLDDGWMGGRYVCNLSCTCR